MRHNTLSKKIIVKSLIKLRVSSCKPTSKIEMAVYTHKKFYKKKSIATIKSSLIVKEHLVN